MVRGALMLVALCGFSVIRCGGAVAEGTQSAADGVDIRDEQGNVLVAAEAIQSYDWRTHTLTLAAGERAKLAAKLMQSGHIVPGVPFALAVGGKTVFTGKFTTCASSMSLGGVVIVVDAKAIEPNLGEDQLRIDLGYPATAAALFCGIDPRRSEQLRAAFRSARKLAKASPEVTQWITDSLGEMQLVKTGMARAELLRVFEEEGGLSTPTEQTFAYRDSPYVKVRVKFEAVGGGDPQTKSPEDRIVEISQPVLAWPVGD